MAIIDDIKCPRCDRKYSGVRSRCPYCGARRVGFGKYSKDNDNSKGKMLISILILAVFTVAAGAMLLSTPQVTESTPEPTPTPLDDTLTLPSFETPTPEPTPEPTPTPPTEVMAVAVKHTSGEALRFGNDVTIDTATYDLAVFIEPPSVEGVDIRLESDNEEVFTVDWVEHGVRNGFRITAVSNGVANLIVSAGGMTVTVIIRISR